MGTNYYLHLGKRSATGNGKSMFTPTIPLPPVPYPGGVTVINEYGEEMSFGDFWNMIKDDHYDLDYLGERFS